MDFRSGLPFGISSGRDNSFSGIGQDRADLLREPRASVGPAESGATGALLRSQAVTFNAPGTLRQFARATSCAACRPSISTLLVQKAFPITRASEPHVARRVLQPAESRRISVCRESSVASPNTLGVINGASDPRILQLGARLSFSSGTAGDFFHRTFGYRLASSTPIPRRGRSSCAARRE